MLNSTEKGELEALIDSYSIGDVLEALAGICTEKAEHLRTNWQDHNAARAWDRDANKITKVAAKLEN